VLNYPAPPQGGTLVTGELVRSPLTEDYWVIHVPLSVVGNPAPGSRLESLSAFTFARNHSAGLTITTAEAEAGILPIEVDGICCRDAAM
jgi:hypothetical protein